MKRLAAAVLLGAYGALMLEAAWRLSPTWDEITYPAAGLAQWETRSIDLNREHPFLAKWLAAAPLLALRPSLPFDHASWAARDEYRFGYQFTFHNHVPARRLIFWSRVPAVFFAVMTGALLLLWVQSLWGTEAALISFLCYAATPILLSRASLALLEAPMYFFMLLSLWLHFRWESAGRRLVWVASGISLGLALLCKFPALPLIPCYFLLAARRARKEHQLQPFLNFCGLIGIAALTWLGAFLPWRNSGATIRLIGWNLMHFDTILSYYWHGAFWVHPPALLSWAAFFIKAPLFVLVLAGWGLAAAWRAHDERIAHWLSLSVCCFFSVFFFRGAVTSVQFSPLYLGLAGLAGYLGHSVSGRKPLATACIAALLLASGVDAWSVHPNYLSYFSPLVGGARHGYQWLGDSDQDWGQSLPTLATYLETHGRPNVLLAYSGASDPRAYGLRFQDLLSPALFARETQGEMIGPDPRPVWVALSTKVLQSEPRYVNWLRQNVAPLVLVDNCFFLYDITRSTDAYRWAGAIYAETGRPAQARWAFERAQALDPGKALDRQALQSLAKK